MSTNYYIRLSERGQGRTYADKMLRKIIEETKGIMPQSKKCYHCKNFNHFDSGCELWHAKIKKKGECDYYIKD